MMRERLRQIWRELEAEPGAASGVRSRRLLAELPADLYAALHYPEATRMLMLRAGTGVIRELSPDFVQLRGVRTHTLRDPADDSSGFVALKLVEVHLADLFDTLIADLVGALAPGLAEREQILAVTDRLRHWQELFSAYRGGELSPEAQKGLFGELLWLRYLLERGVDRGVAVAAWQGSPGGDQDFVRGASAVEVKTLTPGQNFAIGSERQLDDSAFERLVLVEQQVRSDGGGTSLPDEVEAVRQALLDSGEAARQFEVRLAQGGYLDVHGDRYAEVRYAHEGTRAYEVKRDFPRIVPHLLPPGVQGVRYSITPATCAPFLTDVASTAELFR